MDDWNDLLEQPLEERFDPTWPFNFKWGYDSKSNVVHVWRVKGGTDGRPTHRAELRQLWGRDPQVRDGDVLGLATYIPAERKIDGTVVAPPEVQVQAYYGQAVPQEVYDWFDKNFPDAVAREATISKPRLGKTANDWHVPEQPLKVLKWVWSRQDGLLIWQPGDDELPTHQMKIQSQWGRPENAQDVLGFAVWEPGEVEVQSYGENVNPQAYGTVKQELSKMFPHDEIIVPDSDPDSFSGPPVLGHRMSAAEWAQATFTVLAYDPLEGHGIDSPGTHVAGTGIESDSPGRVIPALLRLFKTKPIWKTADADMDGAMVALFLPKEVGKKIKIRGGEPVEQMHITLLYFEDKAADRDWDEVIRITEQIANQTPVLKGKISGYGVFSNDVDVLWASPSIMGLAELRHKLYEACEDAGFHVSTDHDWVPHITLKYDWKGKLPKVEPIEFEIDTLTFARGDDHEDFKLDGSFEKKARVDDFDWSMPENEYWATNPQTGYSEEWGPKTWSGWQGAHRFVTDGKEILTEPEEDLRLDGKGWHGQGHPALEDKFYRFYPDAQGFVSGWVVPTADDMGYGIFAPSAGFGGPHEPGLEDVMHIVDKHFGKPSHFVNDLHVIKDPQKYKTYPEGGHFVGLSA